SPQPFPLKRGEGVYEAALTQILDSTTSTCPTFRNHFPLTVQPESQLELRPYAAPENVSHCPTLPLVYPRSNHSCRCAAVPCVNVLGITTPCVRLWMASSPLCPAALIASSISPLSSRFSSPT